MRFSNSFLLPASVLVSAHCVAANLVVYWGQGGSGDGSQEQLGAYCKPGVATFDVIIISFLNSFTSPFDSITAANLNTANIEMSTVGADITYCQSQGKKVLLSIGGDQMTAAKAGWSSAEEAALAAKTTYETFAMAGDKNNNSPFGAGVVDGFDLDIESEIPNIDAFAKSLRSSAQGKIIAAAPQCPYPDRFQTSFLDGPDAIAIDMAFVQFYNTPYCATYNFHNTKRDLAARDTGFNLATWQDWATNSPNPSVQLYVGTPGAPGAANGFAPTDTLVSINDWASSSIKNYAGIMVWEASFMAKPQGLGLNCPILAGVGNKVGESVSALTSLIPTTTGAIIAAPSAPSVSSAPPAVSSSVVAAPVITPDTAVPVSDSNIMSTTTMSSTTTSTNTITVTSTAASDVSSGVSNSTTAAIIDTSVTPPGSEKGEDGCYSSVPVTTAPAKEWGQCGGKCFKGVASCESGLMCTVVTEWWSDCRKTGSSSKREEHYVIEKRDEEINIVNAANQARGMVRRMRFSA